MGIGTTPVTVSNLSVEACLSEHRPHEKRRSPSMTALAPGRELTYLLASTVLAFSSSAFVCMVVSLALTGLGVEGASVWLPFDSVREPAERMR